MKKLVILAIFALSNCEGVQSLENSSKMSGNYQYADRCPMHIDNREFFLVEFDDSHCVEGETCVYTEIVGDRVYPVVEAGSRDVELWLQAHEFETSFAESDDSMVFQMESFLITDDERSELVFGRGTALLWDGEQNVSSDFLLIRPLTEEALDFVDECAQ